MAVEPKMDFRYRDSAGVEIEAFQITKGARFASHDWPPWLQTQKSGVEVNKVYTDSAAPKSLFIKLDSGEYQIADDAYVIHEGGVLRVQDGEAFDNVFTKVVPIPPRILDEESLAGFERTHRMEDGKLVKLSPEEIAALPPETVAAPVVPIGLAPQPVEDVIRSHDSNLRPKVEIAFEMLADNQIDVGLDVLKKALADETDWCSCAPGQCTKGPRWGCRELSPLVKA